MNNKAKGPSIATLIVPVLFLAFGIISLILYSDLIFGTKVTNINKLLQQGTVGANVDSYVELDVDAVLDNFAETSHKRNGITIGKDQHFLVWLDDDSMIAVSVKSKKDVKAMEDIMDVTWDYVEGKRETLADEPLHLKGKLQKMSSEMKNYYQKSLDYFGITSADRDIHYYVVDCTDSQLLAILVTAFFFVVAIPMLLAFIKGRAKAKREALVEEDMGFSYPKEYSAYNTGFSDPAIADDMEYTAPEVPVGDAAAPEQEVSDNVNE